MSSYGHTQSNTRQTCRIQSCSSCCITKLLWSDWCVSLHIPVYTPCWVCRCCHWKSVLPFTKMKKKSMHKVGGCIWHRNTFWPNFFVYVQPQFQYFLNITVLLFVCLFFVNLSVCPQNTLFSTREYSAECENPEVCIKLGVALECLCFVKLKKWRLHYIWNQIYTQIHKRHSNISEVLNLSIMAQMSILRCN